MPFSYSFVGELLLIRCSGVLTPKALYDAIRSYQADPAFHPEIDLLFVLGTDLSVHIAGSTSDDLEARSDERLLDQVARQVRATRKKARYRTVCAGGTRRNRTFFQASLEMVNHHAEIRAFRTVRRALHWLGVEPPFLKKALDAAAAA